MSHEPPHGCEEAHPFPDDWCVASDVSCFVQNNKNKEDQKADNDKETQHREDPGQFLEGYFLYSYDRLKKDNTKEIKANPALMDSRSNAEGHCGHQDCADHGQGADRQYCYLKSSFVLTEAAEPKYEKDNDDVAQWGSQECAGVEKDLWPSRCIPNVTQVGGKNGEIRVDWKVG